MWVLSERMAPPIITVSNLVKRYDQVTAVDDISFSVSLGEDVGLLGAHGAGKTTTLDIIETQKTANPGTVTGEGLDVDAIGPLVQDKFMSAFVRARKPAGCCAPNCCS